MPEFDGTGPRGKGPRTGRGLGKCSKNSSNTSSSRRRPLGFGRGRRRRP